jgi:hypothetical protein
MFLVLDHEGLAIGLEGDEDVPAVFDKQEDALEAALAIAFDEPEHDVVVVRVLAVVSAPKKAVLSKSDEVKTITIN